MLKIHLPTPIKTRLIKTAEWALSPEGLFSDKIHRRFAWLTATAFVLLGAAWLAFAIYLYVKGLPHGYYFGFYR